jgi:hypothetical protein
MRRVYKDICGFRGKFEVLWKRFMTINYEYLDSDDLFVDWIRFLDGDLE